MVSFWKITILYLNSALFMQRFAHSMSIEKVVVKSAGKLAVNGVYTSQDPKVIPEGFARTCRKMGWTPSEMWRKLSDQKRPWFEAENESYMYWNRGDGKWWMDEPSGSGVYVCKSDDKLPPKFGWTSLMGVNERIPVVEPIIKDEERI
mmetsp:Transcript_30956/g.40517  ORF Transcript_30956/g.40517 Transcript_30956/m.40517 type:complete len:148 (-) Transcript_30956:121-564(-)